MMTNREALHIYEHSDKYPVDVIMEADEIAYAALRAQMADNGVCCGNCDFWRDNDPRCMCEKSQWAGKTTKRDNYCGCFLWISLTLDELREMDMQPVYILDLCGEPPSTEGWIVFRSHNENGFHPRGAGWFSVDGYGRTWLAYRRKPDEAGEGRRT